MTRLPFVDHVADSNPHETFSVSVQQKIVFAEMEHATAAELSALIELDVISSADCEE